MRQSQKSNRPRNKNGRKPSGPSPNRVYESSGPEGKVRGTPQQIIEKYQSLARDKATSGDRVMSEAFLQHAEHYMRILTASQPSRSDDRGQDERQQPDERGHEDRMPEEQRAAEVVAGEDRADDGRSMEEPAEAFAADDESPALSESLAVIGAETDGPVMVDTPENAGRRGGRGRRPMRRSAKSDEDGGGEDAEKPARPRRRRAPSPTAEEQPAELALEPPATDGDDSIRAAE